jgi:maleylacetate reductase
VIVRWRLAELADALAELDVRRPFLLASRRWRGLELPPHAGRHEELPAPEVDVPADADGILAVGGGSAIDTGKHASARTGLPLVSVPTTYSGAEWTTGFGIRTPDRRIVGGGGGARLAAIVYDVDLTLDLPLPETVGTALNALAHCAEALYARGRTDAGDHHAVEGATLLADALPAVVDAPHDRDARERLLRGAAHAGEALAEAGLCLGHAMAQAVGGTYGIAHGAANAVCLPPALVFNRELAPAEVARYGEAIGGDAVDRTRELAALGGFRRLRDLGVPRDELPQLAETAAARGGNRNNPRPATPAEVLALLESAW